MISWWDEGIRAEICEESSHSNAHDVSDFDSSEAQRSDSIFVFHARVSGQPELFLTICAEWKEPQRAFPIEFP